MSPTPDSTLDDPQQVIADLQRANVELQRRLDESNAERDEALKRETATAEVLGVINSSPGELGPVFDAMLEKAMQLCGAAFGQLHTYDGEGFQTAALRGVPALYAEYQAQNPPIYGLHTAPWRILQGERVVHIVDLANSEAYRAGDAARRAIVDLGGCHTLLTIALRREDTLLGIISLYRKDVQPFSDKQIALLQNFAAQAVIAMENARLISETQEALEQQTATAEVLQVINSSPGDLTPVFDAMLEKATTLCEAAYGTLFTYDGERFHAVALRGVPAVFADALNAPVRPEPGAALDRLVRGERYADCADVANEAAYRGSAGRALVELGGARSTLAVPLRKDDVLLGAFAIYRQEVRPFSDKQIALLRNFAAQAVIAMENARLITETREALEQQTATAEVLGVINSSPGDLAPVFDAILEKAHTLCDAATGSLRVIDGEMIRAVAFRGQSGEFADRVQQGYPFASAPLLASLRDGAPFVHISDVAERDDSISRLSTASGNRTILAVPLRKDDALLGMIVAGRQEVRPFTDKQIALLQNFSAQAVIAMENARLINETREALEQQTATAEVLGVINSSPGDLVLVFNAILEKAHGLCGITFGTLQLYDGEKLRAVATRGVPEPQEKVMREPYAPDLNSPLRGLIDGGRFVQFPDLAERDTQVPNPRSRIAVELGIRTLLFLPLRKDNLLLGLISAARTEVKLFSEREIVLLENFAAQAVIAMENARLITETRERTSDLQESLEYQRATSDVLKVISRSTFDLQPVLETLTETAARLCEANTANIMRLDGDVYRAATALGYSPEYKAFLERNPFAPGRGSITGRVALEHRPVHVLDVENDPEYTWTEGQKIGKFRTMLGVPLLREDALLGVIFLARTRVEPFTERQIELVRTFADQAVIAIENARLLDELRQRTEEVRELNRGLEAQVAEQVDELGRVGRLKRFLAPQLAELIVSQGDEKILESHRREIVVVFCDLRGYTAFTETAEPEEVLDFLREYHGALGPLVSDYEGTLDQFSGDGIMVFFNDPVPCPDPAERAVKMAMAMREEAGKLISTWRRDGCELGFGAGIAQGYATLGQIGFSERSGYTAIGTVCNLAARLCAEAKDGQILISSRVARAVEAVARLEDLGNLELKGLRRPVAAFNVVQSTSPAEARPSLTVVARGPGA